MIHPPTHTAMNTKPDTYWMRAAGVVITCAARQELLQRTLQSYQEAGFDAPFIEVDHTGHDRVQTRQEYNSLNAMKTLLTRKDWNVGIFFEDDVIFNPHTHHNLAYWKPMWQAGEYLSGMGQVKDYFFGSLYDPTIRELAVNREEAYFIADPGAVYGSQCYVFSRAMAEYFVAHWWEVEGMQDIKMSRLAAKVTPIYYHLPSLVQHVGVKSTFGGRFHDTKEYDGTWKAGVKREA